MPASWVHILFGRRSFPRGWGLYVSGSLGHTVEMSPGTYSFALVSKSGKVVGLYAELAGYRLVLLMTEPGFASGVVYEHSIYRPSYMSAERDAKGKSIYFHWDQVGSEHHGVNLAWLEGSQ